MSNPPVPRYKLKIRCSHSGFGPCTFSNLWIINLNSYKVYGGPHMCGNRIVNCNPRWTYCPLVPKRYTFYVTDGSLMVSLLWVSSDSKVFFFNLHFRVYNAEHKTAITEVQVYARWYFLILLSKSPLFRKLFSSSIWQRWWQYVNIIWQANFQSRHFLPKGASINYVGKILPIFDHPLPLPK